MHTTVRSVDPLTPHIRRIVVGGADLEGFDPSAFTDSYVKVQLPPPGAGYRSDFDLEEIRGTRPRAEWPRTRSITVRAWDGEQLTLDFVVHGDEGAAGPWAARAQPGDVLQLSGPGGAYSPDPAADWHLLVGDASVVPAICASLERIPAGAPAFVLVETEDEADARLVDGARWVSGDNSDPERLLVAVAELELPTGRGHAFVHGEASAVRAVRRHLLVERGLPAERLSASGYWKLRRTDEAWRAEKAEWKRLAAADVAAAG